MLGLAAAAHASIVGVGLGVVLVASERVAHAEGKGTSTAKLIEQAKEKFEDQQYDESMQKLSAALLKSDITQAQKIEVYRWLAYNYILLKQDDAARTAIFALYAVDEDYELPRKESPRFREPFAKYKAQWIEEGRPGKPKPTEKPPAAVVVKQLPVTTTPHDQRLEVKGSFDDPDDRISHLSLYYRSGSSGKFDEVAVRVEGSHFHAVIPATAVKPPLVEYYVAAYDKGGLPIASRGDSETPLRVAVEAEQSSSILETWWFWTAVGVVLAGTTTAIIVTRKSEAPSGPPQAAFTVTVGQ
ncbi:MAG: hypothetical protein ACHREM_09340 [Polyangiales bacterium]